MVKKERKKRTEMVNQQQELRRRVIEILSMEDLVPKGHLLRQIDGEVDCRATIAFPVAVHPPLTAEKEACYTFLSLSPGGESLAIFL